jgi:predicted nucleic acid-binding protein
VPPSVLVLDAGALIAIERGQRFTVILLERAVTLGTSLVVPAGALAQAWRNSRTQVRLGRFLSSSTVQVEPLDNMRARAAGQLCALRGTRDVIDASVVLSARARGCPIVTTDPEDLAYLDPSLELVRV